MKFNLKALAAAALLATAGSAFALVDTVTAGPNADVMFAAYDFGAGVGFILDTNINYSQLTGAPGSFLYTLDLDNSAAWTQFLAASAAAGGASTGVQWAALSGANNATGFVGGALYGNNDVTTPVAMNSISAGAVRLGFSSLANIANVGDADNGFFVPTPDVGAQFTFAGDFATKVPFNVTETYSSSLPSSQNLFKTNIASGFATIAVGTASIGAGNVLTLTAPVPEPGTYALMFAGLMTLGAVARRRSRR